MPPTCPTSAIYTGLLCWLVLIFAMLVSLAKTNEDGSRIVREFSSTYFSFHAYLPPSRAAIHSFEFLPL